MESKEGISRRTLREQIVEVLRQRIFQGEIRPGEKIKELDLAEQFHVSRGPIREALRQIEQEGLVEYVSHKGCTVKTLTYQDIQEVYCIRSELELLAVRFFQGKMSPEGLERTEQVVVEIGKAAANRDLYRVVRWDERFHASVVAEAKSGKLLQLWGMLEGGNLATYYTMNEESLMPIDYIERNHRCLLNELKHGTQESICKAIQEHYMVVPESLYEKQHQEQELVKIGNQLEQHAG